MPIISKITLPDNTTYDVTDGRGMFVGSCSTSAATQTKDVSISADQNFVLRIGAVIAVKFTYSNTYKSTTSAPCKLNVNGTGAKNIYWVNTATPNNTTSTIAFGTAGYYHFYVYDGSNWVWVGYSNESNTTYSGMTVAEIEAGTSSTNHLISPANLKLAVETWSPSYTKSEIDSTVDRIDDDISGLRTATAKIIDTGAKNLLPTPNGQSVPPTRWVNVPIVLQPGTYRVFFGDLQSDDTDDTRCQACFLSGATQVSNWLTFDRGTNVYSGVCTITAETTIFRLYPSTAYALSEGDTVTFTNCMICKECDWQISQEYVPYCPTNSELYAAQYVHDSVQVNLNDVTWTKSGGGLYYSSTITIPNSPITRMYHATLSGFGNIRATDIITPAVRRSDSWSGFVLYANTDSFLSSAWVTVSVSGVSN